MDYKRKGYEHLCFSGVIEPFIHDDNKEDYLNFLTERGARELSIKLYQAAVENGDLAFHVCKPEIREAITRPYLGDRGEELFMCINYKPFVHCGECLYFHKTDFNGGICTRMQCLAHIMDGCTFGEKGDVDGHC